MVTVVRKRIKVGKAHKWARGRTSDSNPTTRKYRSAISHFNQPESKDSLILSKNALEYLDAESQMSSIHTATTAQTFNTWATNWTGCSNPTFSQLFHLGKFEPEIHKKLLAVVATAAKLLGKENLGESNVEYFSILTNILQKCGDRDTLGPILYCTKLIIKNVPHGLLCQKYELLTDLYVRVMKDSPEDVFVVNSALECVGMCLMSVPSDGWTFPPPHLDAFLSHSTHPNSKIRKKVRKFVGLIVDHLPESKVVDHLTRFTLDSLADNHDSLYVLALCGLYVRHLRSCIPQLFDALLHLLQMNVSKMSLAVFKVLQILFKSRNKHVSPSVLSQFVQVVSKFRPNNGDPPHLTPFIQMYDNASRLLLMSDPSLYSEVFGTVVGVFLDGLASTGAVAGMCCEAVTAGLGQGCLDGGDCHGNVRDLIARAELCLTVHYKDNFVYVFKVFETIYNKLAGKYGDLLHSSLVTLAALRSTEGFEYVDPLERAIGAAVSSGGPELVLSAIPLDFDPRDRLEHFSRSWLLPLLAKSVRNTDIGYFVQTFLPLIDVVHRNCALLEQCGRVNDAKALSTVKAQLWNLLPGFCDGARNLANNVDRLAERMYHLCTSEPGHVGMVMKSLLRLIRSGEGRVLSKYVPTFVSFCINQLVGGSECQLHAQLMATIRESLAVLEAEDVAALVGTVVRRMAEGNRGLLSVGRCLVGLIDGESLDELVGCLGGILDSVGGDSGVEKRVYLLMGDVLQSRRDFNFGELVRRLNGKTVCSSPAKAARFRCLLLVLGRVDHFDGTLLEGVIAEGIIGVGEVSRKARDGAVQLVNGAFVYVMRTMGVGAVEAMGVVVSKLMVGLVGDVVVNTLVVINSLIAREHGAFGEDMAVLCFENGVTLLGHADRAVVVESLGFVHSMMLHFDSAIVCRYLHKIIPAVMAVDGLDASSKVRIKRRRILTKAHKLIGVDALKQLVPEQFHKVVSNVAKSSRRKTAKRTREAIPCVSSDSDVETATVKSGAGVRIANEGIVDLADPSAITKTIVTKSRKPKRDVPVTADGKLLLMGDDGVEGKKVRPKKTMKKMAARDRVQKKRNRTTLPASQRRARRRHGH